MAIGARFPLMDEIRCAAERVGREAGYRLVVLFGSATCGDRPPEDLDVAILASGPLDAVDATNRLIRALGVQPVDVADLGRADALLAALVARDGLPLYEVEPGAFAAFASLALRRFADTRKFRVAEREEIRGYVAGRGRGDAT